MPCRKCGLPKVGENRTSRGGCRKCAADYASTHYRENRASYVWKGNKAKQKLIQRNTTLLVDYLLTHPCVDCGEKDVLVLDFDHRDPTGKVMDVACLTQRVKAETLLTEVLKCDVRCANCHRRKTARELGHSRYKILLERGLCSSAGTQGERHSS